ncbi:MAG: glycosyltransferase family 2 protein, partial [Bacteroidota bacterium]
MEEIDINICIPNYNYGNYLDQTLNSLYAQEDKNFKVYISDNCSNDNSLDVIRKWSSKFVEFEWQQNESNIGFAGNLDAVGRMVKTGYMIMLSSDDMVLPRAVSDYKNLINHLNQSEYKKFVLGSLAIKVDEKGKEISLLEKDSKTWNENDIDPELSKTFGTTIYKVKANEMIRRCLTHFRTPLPFLSVCYP